MKTKFHNSGLLAIIASVAIIIVSCNRTSPASSSANLLDKTGIDSTVRPQDDFFHYANGAWIKNAVIPPSESSWGTFNILYLNTISNLKSLLDSCARLNAAKGSKEQQAGDFFSSAMDSTSIEQKGISPLNADIQRIEAIKSSKEVFSEVATEYKMKSPNFDGAGSFLIFFYAFQDDKNSSQIVAHFDQGGLGLPNKDYYVKQDSATKNIRNSYVQYIANVLQLAGDDSSLAKSNAATVMNIENELAKASKSPVELRDPEANYNKLSIQDLNIQTPNIDWTELMNALGVQQDTVLIGQPAFYKHVSALLKSIPLNHWKHYLRFHLIDNYAPYLSAAFVNARFEKNKLLSGQKELKARWKRMVALSDEELGDVVGELYVKKYFPSEAKQKILEVADNVQQTFKERIEHLDWMSDSTKRKAILKLDAIERKIGYPDKWKNYSSVEITKSDLIGNLKNVGQFNYRFMINKIGKAVDKSEWFITPPTIDAYYLANANDINFPAGILQPPFFYNDGDDALNYGAIGVIIGHELTHGFDDQGRQYDEKGNLKNWWLASDSAQFRQKADRVVKQYNASIIKDTFHINGELSQGENIADIGGVSIAYEAFKKTKDGKSTEKIDGFTPDQRFFIAYAQAWKTKWTPELEKSLIMGNPHSTPKYRVNNPFSDVPAFYAAFNVKPGDKMYVPDSLRAEVW